MSEESTTPDLVELQKRLTEAGNRRDVDAQVDLYAPDGVWDMSLMGMGVFEGQTAVRRFFEDWFAPYENYEAAAEAILDLVNGVGLRILTIRGRPVGTSGEVALRYACDGVRRD